MVDGIFELLIFAGYSIGCFALGAWVAAIVLEGGKHSAGR